MAASEEQLFLATLERAAIDADQAQKQSREGAEETLSRLRGLSRPYLACIYALERSSVPAALFHALSIVKSAALREFSSIPEGDLDSVRDGLLRIALQRLQNSNVGTLEQGQWVHVVAVLFKLSWMRNGGQPAQQRALLNCLAQIVSVRDAESSSDVRLCFGLKLVRALLSEFCATEASPLGLPLDVHVQCHLSFEKTVLLSVFWLIFNVLLEFAPRDVVASSASLRFPQALALVCGALEQVLSWSFVGAGEGGDEALRVLLSSRDQDELQGCSDRELRPGAQWTEALLQSSLIDAMFVLHKFVVQNSRAMSTAKTESALIRAAHSIRVCLLRLASLQGSVIPRATYSDPQVAASALRIACSYRTSLLSGLADLLRESAAGVGQHSSISALDGPLLLDLAQVFQRLCVVQPEALLGSWAAQADHEAAQKTLFHAVQLSRMLIGPALASASELETSVSEASECLLDGFACLVQWSHSQQQQRQQQQCRMLLTECAGQLFATFVLERLRWGRAEIVQRLLSRLRKQHHQIGDGDSGDGSDDNELNEQFHDAAHMREQLSTVARLGRANVVQTLDFLTTELVRRTTVMRSLVSAMAGPSGAMNMLAAVFPEPQEYQSLPLGWEPLALEVPVLASSVVQEELFYIMQLFGYVLVEDEGEDASEDEEEDEPERGQKFGLSFTRASSLRIPLSVMEALSIAEQQQQEHASDPVVRAVEAILQYCDLEDHMLLHCPHHNGLSPLVAHTMLWLLHRWASAYLMPLEGLYPNGISRCLVHRWGLNAAAAISVLHRLVNKVVLNLTLWSHESAVTDATCQLLHSLARNPRLGHHCAASEGWSRLADALMQLADETSAPQSHPLLRLSNHSLRRLVHALCQATDGMENGGALRTLPLETLEKISRPISAWYRGAMVSLCRPILHAEDEILMESLRRLVSSLYMMRGLALVRSEALTRQVFGFMSPFIVSMTDLINCPLRHASGPAAELLAEAVTQALRVVCELARGDSAVDVGVPSEQHAAFMSACVHLLDAFAGYNRERLVQQRENLQQLLLRAAYAPKRLTHDGDEGGDDDGFAALSAALCLLRNLLGREVFAFVPSADSSSIRVAALRTVTLAENGKQISPSDVVFFGLACLLPQMEEPLLQYRHIAVRTFALLEDVVSTFPDKLALLPEDARAGMLRAMQAALRHYDALVIRLGLQTVKAVAEFHWKQHGSPQPSPFGEAVAYFQATVLSMLCVQKLAVDRMQLLRPLSNALLTLILADGRAFGSAAEQMLLSQTQHVSSQAQQALRGAFARLTSANNVGPDLSRRNRERFLTNVKEFVVTVRGLIGSW